MVLFGTFPRAEEKCCLYPFPTFFVDVQLQDRVTSDFWKELPRQGIKMC